MTDLYPKRNHPFAFRLSPLSERRALVFFALLYVLGSFIWANLSAETVSGIAENALFVVALLLPVALILLQMLSDLFASTRFAVTLIIALVVVSAGATTLLPHEAALAHVYRTFSFVALGAALVACLLVRIIRRPWNRRSLPFRLLHAGLILALAGAFAGLLFRVNGYAVISTGDTVADFSLRDFQLTISDDKKSTTVLPLPFDAVAPESKIRRSLSLPFPDLDLVLSFVPISGRDPYSSSRLTVHASHTEFADTAELLYQGPPAVLELGGEKYMLSFGPSRRDLPFEITLVSCSADYHPAGAIPKDFSADIIITDAETSATRHETLRVNHPASASGFSILLNTVDPDGFAPGTSLNVDGILNPDDLPPRGYVILEISRDPGAAPLFAGGLLTLAGLALSFVRRLKTASPSGAAHDA